MKVSFKLFFTMIYDIKEIFEIEDSLNKRFDPNLSLIKVVA